MSAERRDNGHNDRRAHTRGGRRTSDQQKPWYVRQRYWLAAVSLVWFGWRRVVGRRKDA